MRMVRTFLLVVGVGLVASGCAREGGITAGSGGASTITVTTQDSGRTIDLHVADHLVVDLGPAFAGRADGLVRTSIQFPRSLITMSANKGKLGRWEFAARATGTGTITVISAPCGPMLGPAMGAGAPCSVAGGEGGTAPSAPPGGPAMPARLFRVSVHIT